MQSIAFIFMNSFLGQFQTMQRVFRANPAESHEGIVEEKLSVIKHFVSKVC